MAASGEAASQRAARPLPSPPVHPWRSWLMLLGVLLAVCLDAASREVAMLSGGMSMVEQKGAMVLRALGNLTSEAWEATWASSSWASLDVEESERAAAGESEGPPAAGEGGNGTTTAPRTASRRPAPKPRGPSFLTYRTGPASTLRVLNASAWDNQPRWLEACGPSWQALLGEYAAWHARGVATLLSGSLAAASEFPIVVFRCQMRDACGGLGDRLLGVASVFMYALQRRALFFIDWPGFDALLMSPLPALDWRWSDAYRLGRKPGVMNMHQCRFTCLWTRGLLGGRTLRNPLLFMNINRGPLWRRYGGRMRRQLEAWYEEKAPGGVGIGCLYRSMFTLAPELRAYVRPWLPALLPPSVLIAAHIRRGDAVMAINRDGSRKEAKGTMAGYFVQAKFTRRFYRCAAARAEAAARAPAALPWSSAAASCPRGACWQRRGGGGRVWVLVLSDSPEVRAEARAFFGPQLLLDTNISAQHTSWLDRKVLGRAYLGDQQKYERAVLREAVGEWWLLASAHAIVVHVSGFSRTAAAFASTRNGGIFLGMEHCRRINATELAAFGAGI